APLRPAIFARAHPCFPRSARPAAGARAARSRGDAKTAGSLRRLAGGHLRELGPLRSSRARSRPPRPPGRSGKLTRASSDAATADCEAARLNDVRWATASCRRRAGEEAVCVLLACDGTLLPARAARAVVLDRLLDTGHARVTRCLVFVAHGHVARGVA